MTTASQPTIVMSPADRPVVRTEHVTYRYLDVKGLHYLVTPQPLKPRDDSAESD